MIINGKEIRINRETARVSEIDNAYCQLVQKILDEGELTTNRTGINTLAIRGWSYQFDLSKGFPISETKKVVASNFAKEIQWIHQEQSNKVSWLHERENHIWDGWVVDPDCIYRVYEQGKNAIDDPERMVPLKTQVLNRQTGHIDKVPVFGKDNKPIMVKSYDVIQGVTNPRTIKEAVLFDKKYIGTIGKAYGAVNRETLDPQDVEWTLKNDPYDRRMQIVLRVKQFLPEAVLPSCVWAVTFSVTGEATLNASVDQRSADVPVGLPFNIPQYALLTHMYAKANKLKPGMLNWSIANPHIYVDQIPAIQKQLENYKYLKEYEYAIQTSTDEELEKLYALICKEYEYQERRAANYLSVDINTLKMNQRFEIIAINNEELAKEYETAYIKKLAFEHLATRQTPTLDLASHDSLFDYSTDYVSKKDPYILTNPIGNKELVLKNYTHMPFISIPVAQ